MTTFSSSREAVAYALSHRRGPQLARPSIGRIHKGGTYRSEWDAPNIRSCMTRAGIAAGSDLEREIAAWACADGPKPIAAERALRRELDAAGLLKREEAPIIDRSDVVHVEWIDPATGEPMATLGVDRQ